MEALILVSGIAAAAGLFVFVGYKYGAKGKSLAVKYEQEGKQIYIQAHSAVSAKLAAIKAEVEKVEAEAKAEEQAVVARLKKLF